MALTQSITYYASKPFKAEHPIGSGNVVRYVPGDVVPAADWGPSANWLKEAGKIFETAGDPVWVEDAPKPRVEKLGERVHKDDGTPPNGPRPAGEEKSHAASPEDWPQHLGFGLYKLSDGSNQKGKENAEAAQYLINHPAMTEHQPVPDEDPSAFDIASFPISRSGGRYLLSDGSYVVGRDAAKASQAALAAETPKAEEWPKHVAGAKFQLSDGTEVTGKAKAIAAQAALKETA